jgi:hypothetical protein
MLELSSVCCVLSDGRIQVASACFVLFASLSYVLVSFVLNKKRIDITYYITMISLLVLHLKAHIFLVVYALPVFFPKGKTTNLVFSFMYVLLGPFQNVCFFMPHCHIVCKKL